MAEIKGYRDRLLWLSGVLALALLAVVLLTAVQVLIFDTGFFEREYVKYDTAAQVAMSEGDLLRVTDELLAYIRGDRPEMDMAAVVAGQEREVFNAREKTHMIDVRSLYLGAMRVRNICLGLWLVGLAFLVARRGRRAPGLWARGFVNTFLGVLVIFALLGIIISKNFTVFWNNFHLVFFSNDLWILNPATDLMIVMFQEGFFFDLVVRILTGTAGALGCILLLAMTALRFDRRNKRRGRGARWQE